MIQVRLVRQQSIPRKNRANADGENLKTCYADLVYTKSRIFGQDALLPTHAIPVAEHVCLVPSPSKREGQGEGLERFTRSSPPLAKPTHCRRLSPDTFPYIGRSSVVEQVSSGSV